MRAESGRHGERRGGVLAALHRRSCVADPDGARLATAVRTSLSVALAVGGVLALSIPLRLDALTVALLSGLVALFAAPATGPRALGWGRFPGLLAIVPAASGVVLGVALPGGAVFSIVSIAFVAAVAVWVGRFGRRTVWLGQLGFVAFYFTLLLEVGRDALSGALLAASAGVLASWGVNAVPLPGVWRARPDTTPDTRLRGGEFERRSLRAAVATGLALWLGSLVSATHQLWAAMPAFEVSSGPRDRTRLRGVQRILATVGGAVLAFGLAFVSGRNVAMLVVMLVVTVFLTSFFRAASSPWTAFARTMLFATVYDGLGALNAEALEVRIAETVVGAGVAVIVSVLALPGRRRPGAGRSTPSGVTRP